MSPDPGAAARVATGLADVRARIASACARAGRDPARVKLLAVSKRHSPEAMRAAHALGQREFGENYVQELVQKAAALADLPDLRLRLIGHLQRNKIKDVLRAAATVDTLDSVRLAEALAERASAAGVVVPVLVQVNIGDEPQKSGVAEAELSGLVAAIRGMASLELQGLLAIPPAELSPDGRRPLFRRLRELAGELALPELSIGMSDDLEVAIEEGATMVRVGTAIFGQRP
jgi:pyridoxal phosphate enzyme (YggS family)